MLKHFTNHLIKLNKNCYEFVECKFQPLRNNFSTSNKYLLLKKGQNEYAKYSIETISTINGTLPVEFKIVNIENKYDNSIYKSISELKSFQFKLEDIQKNMSSFDIKKFKSEDSKVCVQELRGLVNNVVKENEVIKNILSKQEEIERLFAYKSFFNKY